MLLKLLQFCEKEKMMMRDQSLLLSSPRTDVVDEQQARGYDVLTPIKTRFGRY